MEESWLAKAAEWKGACLSGMDIWTLVLRHGISAVWEDILRLARLLHSCGSSSQRCFALLSSVHATRKLSIGKRLHSNGTCNRVLEESVGRCKCISRHHILFYPLTNMQVGSRHTERYTGICRPLIHSSWNLIRQVVRKACSLLPGLFRVLGESSSCHESRH